MIDLKQAMLDPSSIFKNPMDVVECGDIARNDKIHILRRWEYDAREMQVAEEENMQGPHSDLLYQVLEALGKLNAEPPSHDHSAPTKQGGE